MSYDATALSTLPRAYTLSVANATYTWGHHWSPSVANQAGSAEGFHWGRLVLLISVQCREIGDLEPWLSHSCTNEVVKGCQWIVEERACHSIGNEPIGEVVGII